VWIGTEKKLKTKSRNAYVTAIGFLTERVQNTVFIIKESLKKKITLFAFNKKPATIWS